LVIICFLDLKGDSFFLYNLITDLGQAIHYKEIQERGGSERNIVLK